MGTAKHFVFIVYVVFWHLNHFISAQCSVTGDMFWSLSFLFLE